MKTFRILTALLVIAMVCVAVQPAAAQAGLPPLCSGVQLQNATTTAADNVSMAFYATTNTTGTADYTYPVAGGLAANASKSFYIPTTLPSSVLDGIYSVVVNSSQQLNSLVNEVTCDPATQKYVVASHSGVQASQVGTTVYLGYVLSRAFAAKWSSVIAIQNAGTAAATDVKIDFFAPGSSTAVKSFTHTDPLQPGVTWYLDLSDTTTYGTVELDGFNGAAKITSTQPLAAVANYAPADGSRLLSYNGVTATSQHLYATQITKHAFASDFTSGITLYNPNGSDTPISVKFFKTGETAAVCTITGSVGANSAYVKYMGSINTAADCNGGGILDNGFNGYLVVDVTSGSNGIIGIFNFDSAIGQSGGANMPRSEDASTVLYFPQIVRNAFGGYQSGWQVNNTGGTALTLITTYTKSDGTTHSENVSLAANSSATVYVGSAAFQTSLGDNWNGGLKVEVQGGTGKIVGQANIIAAGTGDTLSVYNAFTP